MHGFIVKLSVIPKHYTWSKQPLLSSLRKIGKPIYINETMPKLIAGIIGLLTQLVGLSIIFFSYSNEKVIIDAMHEKFPGLSNSGRLKDRDSIKVALTCPANKKLVDHEYYFRQTQIHKGERHVELGVISAKSTENSMEIEIHNFTDAKSRLSLRSEDSKFTITCMNYNIIEKILIQLRFRTR